MIKEAKCKVCDQIISIANKGLRKHLQTDKHKKKIQDTASKSKIDSFLQTNLNKSHYRSVQVTEATLVYHTIKNHQSSNSLDCTTSLCKCIHSDSQIANDVFCCHTKA